MNVDDLGARPSYSDGMAWRRDRQHSFSMHYNSFTFIDRYQRYTKSNGESARRLNALSPDSSSALIHAANAAQALPLDDPKGVAANSSVSNGLTNIRSIF